MFTLFQLDFQSALKTKKPRKSEHCPCTPARALPLDPQPLDEMFAAPRILIT